MIRIGSIDTETKRQFTPEESAEMIPVWMKLTRKASDRSLKLTSVYGRVDRFDPERNFLADEVNSVLQNWSAKIRRLGAEPRELWTVAWMEEGSERTWQLDKEEYALGDE